jgi:hypothetical protein
MTPPPRLVPQAGPAVWSGDSLSPADWMLPIGAEEAACLETLAAAPDDAGRARREVPPRLVPVLQAVAERLENGRGFVLLRGLPLDRLGAGGPEAALLALAARLGTALPQDEGGSLLRFFAGPGTPEPGPPRFQADPADAVGLLCLRQAREGGSIALFSAAALHNALLKADRAALATLYEGLPQRVGQAAPMTLPVFSMASGAFIGRCDHDVIAGEALTEPQRAALAALVAAATAPGMALRIPLHPGDLLFRNPQLVWKQASRAEEPATEETRHLLRLWLAMPNSRALPESFRALFGETAAGAPRGGVQPSGHPGAGG